MLRSDHGFDTENFVHISLQGRNYKQLNAELSRNSEVEGITSSSAILGTFVQNESYARTSRDKEPTRMDYFSVDRNFISLMKLKLIAGRNFPSNISDSTESYIILNEKALELLQLGNPQEAIGKTVSVEEVSNKVVLPGDKKELQVIGVIKDFFYQNMMRGNNAMGFRYIPAQFQIASVKLNKPADKSSIAALESTWKGIDKSNDFQYSLYEDEFAGIYGEENNMSVLLFLTLLTITLSCLGILGITTYTTETRAKEIGIRKVMGASVANIVLLLSKNLLMLLAAAGLIALPISLLISKSILQQFANRIEPGFILLLIPFLIMASLALLAICSQTLRTAIANPVKSLRTE
jgi:putative ABC transport system permease protein